MATFSRRTFLGTGGGALAAWLSSNGARAAETGNHRRVGLIGCGWFGKCNLFRLLQVAPVEVVSLCDPDARMLEDAADQVASRQASRKRPRTWRDYREMLAEKDLDLVIIATPDHWHTLPALAATEAGADVFLEKPVSVDVLEGHVLVETARRLGRVVQVNTQRRSTAHLIRAREDIVQAGKLGTIGHIELCCYYHMRVNRRGGDAPPPDWLDWNLWCGPAPLVPFNPAIHPGGWRSFREFGNGIMGDMCIHMLDTARWMLDLGWPTRITSSGGIRVHRDSIASVPDTQIAIFDFPEVQAVWTHRTWGLPSDPDFPWAVIIHGEKGVLKLDVRKFRFTPRGDGESLAGDVELEAGRYPEDADEPRLELHTAPAVRAHMRDWLHAIESRGRPVADIEQGHISSASCILANHSLELSRSLQFDPATHRIPGDAEANATLARPYRGPWLHPATAG